MLTSDIVKKSLQRLTDPRIYARGLEYYQSGDCVREWKTEHKRDGTGPIIITGGVEGSETYEVFLEFDRTDNKFVTLECDCPYKDVCKHAVALGLAFADSIRDGTEYDGDDDNVHTTLRSTIQDVEWSDVEPKTDLPWDEETGAHYPAQRPRIGTADIQQRDLFGQWHPQYTVLPSAALPGRQKSPPAQRTRPFYPKDYFIVLHAYSGSAPTFHEKARPYEQASIRGVLIRKDLASAERALLTYMREGKFEYFRSPPPDLGVFLPLLGASAIPVYRDYSGRKGSEVRIELDPQPLNAEIVHEQKSMYRDPAKVRHDFFLRMPRDYWIKDYYGYEKLFAASGSCLVHDTEYLIALHRMTPLLAGMMSRVGPEHYEGRIGRPTTRYQTRLTGEEIARFNELRVDAARHLKLTSPLPALTAEKSDTCQASFVVDFDATAQTLRVAPVINYGMYRQDVSESIYVSRRRTGDTLLRRAPFEHPGSHIITVAENRIRYASADERRELRFYRELMKRAGELGFTKTLKCLKKGNTQLVEYLRTCWPRLSAYARKQNYPVLFTKDSLAVEQAIFRAEFAANLDAGNDWLHFDVSCYCGDEAMTLEKLLAYAKNGDLFWRKDDGTLIEFTNREELERLLRLLQSFHARENGFEGRLYHAPELEYVLTSSPHYNAARAKSFKKFLADIQKAKPVQAVRLPKKFTGVLRPYQKIGVDWLYFLRSYRFAGILADDMGLGKTLQTLVILSRKRVPGKPSLVVCPKTLVYNWQAEAEKFTPDLRVLVLEGPPQERAAMRKDLAMHDLAVISYSTLKKDIEELLRFGIRFNYAVLDEAQFIKNHATQNAQIAKKIPADYRLALTGTPLENNVSEIWSIFDFLMPGFLGNYEHFSKHFHKPIMDRGEREALEYLRRKVEYFMLRRTKAEVLKDLPPKIEQESFCRLSDAQNILYQQVLLKVKGEVFSAVAEKGFKSAQIHILAGLTKLRQACNHPALLTKEKNWRAYESAKLDMCLELVEEVLESRRKVLIFSQFTQMLDIVSAALADKNVRHLYLSGKTKDRQSMIRAFNTDPAVPVFLISLKAGGTGLNLTAADTVIIFDPWWNPSVEHQAIGRAHRIGQQKTVNVYRLLTTGTIEEKIQRLKEKKQRLFDALVNESGDVFKKLTWDDVRELFA